MRCYAENISTIKKPYVSPILKLSRLTKRHVRLNKWVSHAEGDIPATMHNADIMSKCFKFEISA